MRSDTIVGYTFSADIYCPRCTREIACNRYGIKPELHSSLSTGEGTEETLRILAQTLGIEREDERTFDSDEFPKVIFFDMVNQGNEPDMCGQCHARLDGEEGDPCPETDHRGWQCVYRRNHHAVFDHRYEAPPWSPDENELEDEEEWGSLT